MIEKELLQQAKERLGNNTADIIADILSIEKYDEKSKKGCCPFHNEKTPSFIFDSKSLRFKCFGCGKAVDVVDAHIIGRHLTFNEAASKVFELVGMDVPMPEVGLKSNKSYRYPTLTEHTDMTSAYEYLAKRGISKSVADYAGLSADGKGNIEFPFRDADDVLKTVKLRPAHKVEKDSGKPKCWVQKDTDHDDTLFLMHLANPDEPLLITEGCIDALAAIEAGWRNTVSVPLGAGNTHWIDSLWEWLERFDTIIIAGDNDSAGQKLNKECVARLGQYRTRVLELPQTYTDENGKTVKVSDINEVLFRFGKDKLLECIHNSINKPIPTIIDYSEIREFNLDEVEGVNFGLKEVDKVLMRLFRGSLTLLFAKASAGKTSMTNQIIASALDNDNSVFLYSQELSNQMTASWITYALAGRRNINSYVSKEGSPYYRVTNSARKQIMEYYKGKLFIYKDGESIDIDDILKTAEVCVRRQGVSTIVLDNLTCISCKGCESDLHRQTEITRKCVSFALTYNVSVILCAHARKTSEGLSMDDIAGSSNVANLAGRVLAMERNETGVNLKVVKDRFLGRNGATIPLAFDYPSRRFFTNEDELNHIYSWDKGDCVAENPPVSVALEQMRQQQNTDVEVFG